MPAGYGTERCENCYLRWKLDSRIDMNRAGLASNAMADHFEVFGRWLEREIGLKKAAITINRYLAFFQDIDETWGRVPTYAELLAELGTARLRRAELPMRWLEGIGILTVDPASKLEDSERRRIARMLESLPADSIAGKLLRGYHERLMQRMVERRTSLKSVRLALRPALALLSATTETEAAAPDQKQLDTYLRDRPGQRAAIYGFVNYLREEHGVDVVLPAPRPGRATRLLRERLDREAKALLLSDLGDPAHERKWLILSLRIFYGVPRNTGRKIVATGAARTVRGYEIQHEGKVYRLPYRPNRETDDPGSGS